MSIIKTEVGTYKNPFHSDRMSTDVVPPQMRGQTIFIVDLHSIDMTVITPITKKSSRHMVSDPNLK